MAWGAALGLLMLAFRPAAGGPDPFAAAVTRPLGVPAPCSADGDGTVSAADSGEPALLHRKHQTGNQVTSLLFRAEAAASEGGVAGHGSRHHPAVTRSQDAAKRNSPLRL